ncbi:hypothetical protein AVEN_68390-1 [Araneus ventricosus]|uniref:Uncharacterized protein n=1 Tax=Araneus ventricosus TaxID=182803 RepID=A0A4Y2X2E4_ARAVE|nr:hypothetical protein AVEN_68390-1 [Araneus ventricosus]
MVDSDLEPMSLPFKNRPHHQAILAPLFEPKDIYSRNKLYIPISLMISKKTVEAAGLIAYNYDETELAHLITPHQPEQMSPITDFNVYLHTWRISGEQSGLELANLRS